MGGVFMWKIAKVLWSLVLVLAFLILGALLADKQVLREGFIRMHIRANSNTAEDQREKLAVRDELLKHLSFRAEEMKTVEETKTYLQTHLDEMEACVNTFLAERGSCNRASVHFSAEAFDTREYDGFSLPAGVYESLIVEIGNGEGKNWWCVVFPSLCLQDFDAAATAADFDSGVQSTLTQEDGYEIRFFLLECLGKLENFFHKS